MLLHKSNINVAIADIFLHIESPHGLWEPRYIKFTRLKPQIVNKGTTVSAC